MWPDAEQTGRLLNEARQGDRAAAEGLLALYREPLRRLIRHATARTSMVLVEGC